MNKEELIKYIQLNIECIDLENENELIKKLNEFFSQNVVIPKGKNRHPYADIRHAWLEGVEVEWLHNSGQWVEDIFDHYEYRFKPSETVYEWQWMYKFKNGNEFQFTGYETEDEVHHFMSQLDKDSIGHYATKIEETKRERN